MPTKRQLEEENEILRLALAKSRSSLVETERFRQEAISQQSTNSAQLSLAGPSEFDENGSLVVSQPDGSTSRSQVIGLTEDSILDVVPILSQNGIVVAL